MPASTADRSVLYYDLVYASLSEAARKTLQAMDPAKYEFQSEFAKRYLAQGRAEGRAEGEIRGEAKVLLKLLALNFGPRRGSPSACRPPRSNSSIAGPSVCSAPRAWNRCSGSSTVGPRLAPRA